MAVTKYLWDDEIDAVAMETDGAGTTQAVYNSDPVPFGRLFSMRRGGETRNYRYDGNGNTRALTNSTGQVTDTYRYSAFGQQRAHTGTTENPYRFGGQVGYQYNPATADYDVRARVYQPKRGRWRSLDPLQFKDSSNLYLYLNNSALTAIDPSGLFSSPLQIIRNPYASTRPSDRPLTPRFPIPEPSVSPIGPPSPRPFPPSRDELLDKITLCTDHTEWNKSMCPCPCLMTKAGRQSFITRAQYRTMFNQLKAQYSATNVKLTIAEKTCVPGLEGTFGLTCPPWKTRSKKLYFCLPRALNYCQARALLIHELTHVKQIKDFLRTKRIPPEGTEPPAYKAQCAEIWDQHCGKRETTTCVKTGKGRGCFRLVLEVQIGEKVIRGDTRDTFAENCKKALTPNSTTLKAKMAFNTECRKK